MNDPSPSSPWLVADIGGTHARFGLLTAAGGPVSNVTSLRCAEHAGPEAALRHYLTRIAAETGTPRRPAALALALAAPVTGDTVALTNAAWQVSRPALSAAFDGADVLLLNDFEALAMALPALGPDDVVALGPGRLDARLPMAVIGPGTGLGVAACVPSADGWIALPTEGGHATLAATCATEEHWLRLARQQHPHVSAERLLSGTGLPLLHRVVAEAAGLPCRARDDAADITRQARDGGDRACVLAVEAFCALLGSFAGSVALTLGARGGVVIAGGVAEALRTHLPASAFRERFEAKGRFRDYLASVHTCLLSAPHASLRGAALALRTARRHAAPSRPDATAP
jgi:glucokinase